jgi:hypothetical protein
MCLYGCFQKRLAIELIDEGRLLLLASNPLAFIKSIKGLNRIKR